MTRIKKTNSTADRRAEGTSVVQSPGRRQRQSCGREGRERERVAALRSMTLTLQRWLRFVALFSFEYSLSIVGPHGREIDRTLLHYSLRAGVISSSNRSSRDSARRRISSKFFSMVMQMCSSGKSCGLAPNGCSISTPIASTFSLQRGTKGCC